MKTIDGYERMVPGIRHGEQDTRAQVGWNWKGSKAVNQQGAHLKQPLRIGYLRFLLEQSCCKCGVLFSIAVNVENHEACDAVFQGNDHVPAPE